ncbi:fasciclin domain-containing protein [Planctomycetota bacterium]|nr:fasciclin domain-containing protein [Planctomycetota bacterium]
MSTLKSIRLLGLLAVMSIGVTLLGCSGGQNDTNSQSMNDDSNSMQDSSSNAAMDVGEQANIVNTVVERPQFGTFATALSEADLKPVLEGHGPFTLFAPTNDAFSALPPGVLDKLLKPVNRDKLQMILRFHVVRGYYPADKLVKTNRMLTLEGQSLNVDVRGGEAYVDGARVSQADLDARNGVVHQIDKVLLPAGFDASALK